MSQPFVLTFAQQKSLFALIRETNDASADVAVHPAHSATHGWERAGRRYDAATKALAAFVESISEKPAKPQRKVTG